MELEPKVKTALVNIEFSKKYSGLLKKFDFNDSELFENYDNSIIFKILSDFGYNAKYNKREDFFFINDQVGIYKFQFNMSFKYGTTEFIWAVWENNTLLEGSPWHLLKKLIDGKTAKSFDFRNYEDLKNILNESLKMYEEFKEQIIMQDCNM